MDNTSFRLRLLQLMKKSRKALRLYSSIGTGGGISNAHPVTQSHSSTWYSRGAGDDRFTGGGSASRFSGGRVEPRLGGESDLGEDSQGGGFQIGSRRTNGELSELQVGEWRDVNSELLRTLSTAASNLALRRVVSEVASLRDRFHSEWRSAESRIHHDQKAMIEAATQGDFMRATALGKALISAKARMQACHAAYDELSNLLALSKFSESGELEKMSTGVDYIGDEDAARYNPGKSVGMGNQQTVKLSTIELDQVDNRSSQIIDSMSGAATQGEFPPNVAKIIPIRRRG